MKETTNITKRILSVVFAFLMLLTSVCTVAYAADSFEISIAAFPESYKTYLRELHQKHPKWQFQPLLTGLDWSEAVEAENKPNQSLVTNAQGYTDIFKSRESADYNSSTNTFIQKDAGFVRANKLAVSYYMDPRNFLFDEAVFQFEKLSFDSSTTVEEVESVIAGSFMANKKIEYYNSAGKLVKTNEKYSKVIYDAGKTYDVNPCFLASKIINEVGSRGSASVQGTNKNYPGLYNFYNIGAYDGGNAIEKGLKYAGSGTTYQRPWNSPKKAINGGAQFIAASYIAKGQNTSYLQRFNVNPKSAYTKYTHQYMTNLAGAASPAYNTYRSYYVNGLLDGKYIFQIPVFNNMPASENTSGEISLADGCNQTAKVNTACNLRTGPSTAYSKVGITVPLGTYVQILATERTDSTYHDSIIRYPYWCKISFVYNSKLYEGYVNSEYLTLATQSVVQVGTITPLVFKTNNSLNYGYISSDSSVAQILNDRQIKFLKKGSVTITAYDSLGHYQTVKYKVVADSSDYQIKNLSTKNLTKNSATVTFSKNSYFNEYEIYVTTSTGAFVKKQTALSNSVNITGLKQDTSYKAYVIGVRDGSSSATRSVSTSSLSFKTQLDLSLPSPVSSVKAQNSGYTSVKLSWDASSNAEGYEIYTYSLSSSAYSKLGTVKGKTTFTDTSPNAASETHYAVRSFRTVNGSLSYSDYTYAIYTPSIKPKTVSGIKEYSPTDSSLSLSWNAVSGATSYQIYQYDSKTKKYKKVKTVSSNSCTFSSLSPAKTLKLKIRAVIKVYDKSFYGSFSNEFTAKTRPSKVGSVTASSVKTNSYKLSWKKVSGASGYVVYKYDSKAKKYKKFKTVSTNSLVVSSLKAATSATYCVRAYVKTDSGNFYGSASNTFKATTQTAKPSTPTASSVKATSLKLSWKKVSGATGYVVYKYSDKTKKYTKISATNGTSLSVTNLQKATTYKFAVRATRKTSSMTASSAYSPLCTAKTKK